MVFSDRKKAIISENLIDVFGIIISIFLIFLIGISLFTGQTERGGEVAYASMARQIAILIDRVAAEAGSARMEYEMIRGLPVDVTIGSHEVVLSWENRRKAGASFSAPTGMEEQVIENPSKLCVVKSRNDRKIIVQGGTCECITSDNRCDASCVIDGICDPACIKEEKDYVCLPACARGGDGICDSDCISALEDWVWDSDCARADGVCDPDSAGLQDGVCDPDCLKNQTDGFCDPECIKGRDKDGDGIEDSRDGICDLDCLFTGKITLDSEGVKSDEPPVKDGICDLDCADRSDVCDPDCPDYMEQCSPCAAEGEPAEGKPCCSGLTPCASSNICSVTCCGNGVCEGRGQWPEDYHPKNWENPCTCEQDCPGECPRPETCSAGPFTSGICYLDLMGAFYGGKIEICSDAVKDFLDRRMWDINEVAETALRTGPPLGWGFDDTRYCLPVCGRLQTATTTIEANEAYNLSDEHACCESMMRERGCACTYPVQEEQACGIGFCGDHATAIYSIIRRLGIPSKDVWVTYALYGNCEGQHAFVVHRCNTSLEDRLVLDECRGRNDQWLALDATHHFIRPMNQIGCSTMCLWWNENGYYAQQEGRISESEGWAYNKTAICSPSTWEGGESCQTVDGSITFSCQFNDYCERNVLPCTDFCKEAGITCRWLNE